MLLQLLLPMALHGPAATCQNVLPIPRYGPMTFQLLLPMASHGPIAMPERAADTLGWAHCICKGRRDNGFAWAHTISRMCCRYPRVAQCVTAAAADGFVSAQYLSKTCCRYPRMSSLLLELLLPMALHGPMHSPAHASDALEWTDCIAAVTVADGFVWALYLCETCCRYPKTGQCFFSSCCRWLRVGPYIFQNVLPMP
jgi:hypothetical protein